MSRLPGLAFSALALATIGAFFLTQHLKTATPLIAGFPAPVPAAINPYGSRCGSSQHTITHFSFYLLHQSDVVDVSIVDRAGRVIRHVAVDHPMRQGIRNPDGDFAWNGRTDNGSVAPDGRYLIRVVLLHQHRTVTISGSSGPEPVTIRTVPPRPRILAVRPARVSSPGRVTISFAGTEGRLATVLVYRMAGRSARLVKTFLTGGSDAVWDVRIHGAPAPAGRYLIGLQVTDAACNTGRFPPRLPPSPALARRDTVLVRAGARS